MSWGAKKRIIYICVLALIAFVIISVPVYFKYFDKAPSCFDGVQNQGEEGVDCGGPCALLCPDESRAPLITYQRLYEASPGIYTALAMIENPNQEVFARNVSYVFNIYDANNILLQQITGTTFIPPGREFPIFASPIDTGNRTAVKEDFSFTSNPITWEKGSFDEPSIDVANVVSSSTDTLPRIDADIVNNEVYPIRNMQAVVVVYDADGNAARASATVLGYISPQDKAHVTFTWNAPFDFTVSKIDIIPRPEPQDWTAE